MKLSKPTLPSIFNKLCLLAACLLIALLHFTATPTTAGEPPTTPFIRVNAEMHAARITDITAAPSGKLLATSSLDKTVKIWKADSGRLIRTIRPPVGPDAEGVLNTVAFSADGKFVATGGDTGNGWNRGHSVYIFDVNSGEISNHIDDLPGTILRLAYSPDGSQLAVAFANNKGVSVFKTSDYKLLWSDNTYRGNCFGMDFDRDGNLAIGSDQGFIRMYRPNGKLIFDKISILKKKIYSLKFSPNDKYIAIGFYSGSTNVEILNSSDGNHAFELVTPNTVVGSQVLSSVIWSSSGENIYTAGSLATPDQKTVLLKWRFSEWSGGVSDRIILPTKNAVWNLIALQNGSIGFVSGQDGFGVVARDGGGKEIKHKSLMFKVETYTEVSPNGGGLSFYNQVAAADFKNNYFAFKIAPDANTVQFSYLENGWAKSLFNLKGRKLINDDIPDADLFYPRIVGKDISIQSWDGLAINSLPLSLNYNKLDGNFSPLEKNYSLAIKHDDGGFVLGSTMFIRLFTNVGKMLWKKRIPGCAWGVNISADNRILVATLDDSTIRWYRMQDGMELFALYLHPDRKRWILWTPDGFFDHSPDSENLIGFVLNRGADKSAVMVALNQMYDTFYRPDIIDQAIAGKDISAYRNNLAKPDGTAVSSVQTENERLAREKAEQERLAKQKAEAERLEAERKETERIASLKREEERLAKEKAVQENLSRQKAEEERQAALKTEQERLEKLTLEQEQALLARIKTETARKAEEDRLVMQKAEADRQARLKAEQELLAREKAEQELIAKQKAEADRLETEREEAERRAAQKREEQRLAKEKAEQEKLTSQKAEEELLIRRLVNAANLPPTVRFVTTSGSSSQQDVTLIAELCDTGGGIGDVTLFLNDMPVVIENTSRGLKVQQKAAKTCFNFERTISLQNGRNVISMMAYNKGNNIESERNSIELSLASLTAEKPHLHILTIAVNNYRDGDLLLKYAINDADVLASVINEKAKTLFAGVHLHKLHNADVTKAKLETSFIEIGKQTKRDDVFLLFVAGHGITGERDGAYYFLPVDFRYTGEESIAGQGVSMNDFKKYLTNIQATKSLLLIDTCNSGSFSEAISSRGVTEKTAITKLARAVGRATIAASSKNQVALEGYEGHGVFSYTVLEGMRGKASNKKGEITVNLLANFIEETLPELTYKKWGYEQVPQKSLQGMDFPIGVR